jgi:hypothetical protein
MQINGLNDGDLPKLPLDRGAVERSETERGGYADNQEKPHEAITQRCASAPSGRFAATFPIEGKVITRVS